MTVPGTPNHAALGPQRLRASAGLRALVRETHVRREQLIQPLFVVERDADAGPIDGLPGQERLTRAGLRRAAALAADAGVGGVLLFGVPAAKRTDGSGAWDPDGVVCRAVADLREHVPTLSVITDVCLCAFTTDGACARHADGRFHHAATLEAYARTALAHARAGAHLVAPSGMIDASVGAIRHALDEAGHSGVGIMAYSVKHASAFYGPFRGACASSPSGGDRRWHQMDPANGREALHEAALDLEQGADIVMVKPATTALDILARLRATHPEARLAAYHVSGEYAMLHAAGERGWLDPAAALDETLLALRRAGADIIITYGATDWARRHAPRPL